MSTQAQKTRSPADWSEMFAVFEGNLDQWLARAIEEEPESEPQHAEPISLRTFAERLECLQIYLTQAEDKAEQALAPLTTEIQSLREWLEMLGAARTKLAERTVS